MTNFFNIKQVDSLRLVTAFGKSSDIIGVFEKQLFYSPFVYTSGEWMCTQLSPQECSYLNRHINSSPEYIKLPREQYKKLLTLLDELPHKTLFTEKCLLCEGKDFCYCGSVPVPRDIQYLDKLSNTDLDFEETGIVDSLNAEEDDWLEDED